MRGQQNSVLNQSGNVRASSSLHTWQEGWDGIQIQCWISLEMSGPLPPSTPDGKGERATKFSLESDLNQFWIGYESVLNQIRICFDSDLKCTSVLLQSIANYQEMASRFPGNTSMAFNLCPKESYSGNRGSYWPPTQVFPKNEADIFLELKA